MIPFTPMTPPGKLNHPVLKPRFADGPVPIGPRNSCVPGGWSGGPTDICALSSGKAVASIVPVYVMFSWPDAITSQTCPKHDITGPVVVQVRCPCGLA